jgi:hypothetical protein
MYREGPIKSLHVGTALELLPLSVAHCVVALSIFLRVIGQLLDALCLHPVRRTSNAMWMKQRMTLEVAPGRCERLLTHTLLRTARESLPSYGASLSNDTPWPEHPGNLLDIVSISSLFLLPQSWSGQSFHRGR